MIAHQHHSKSNGGDFELQSRDRTYDTITQTTLHLILKASARPPVAILDNVGGGDNYQLLNVYVGQSNKQMPKGCLALQSIRPSSRIRPRITSHGRRKLIDITHEARALREYATRTICARTPRIRPCFLRAGSGVRPTIMAQHAHQRPPLSLSSHLLSSVRCTGTPRLYSSSPLHSLGPASRFLSTFPSGLSCQTEVLRPHPVTSLNKRFIACVSHASRRVGVFVCK